MKHRLCTILFAALLLSPAFWLQTRGGQISYRDCASGVWHETGVCADALPNAGDRALLHCGLPLADAAALTRALEDFCS